MKRFFYCFIGLCFMTIGFFFYILYFNLFTFGYSFEEYLHFLFTRVESYFFIIGFLLIIVGMKGEIRK